MAIWTCKCTTTNKQVYKWLRRCTDASELPVKPVLSLHCITLCRSHSTVSEQIMSPKPVLLSRYKRYMACTIPGYWFTIKTCDRSFGSYTRYEYYLKPETVLTIHNLQSLLKPRWPFIPGLSCLTVPACLLCEWWQLLLDAGNLHS